MASQIGVLPCEVSSFVGRRKERGELKRLLTVSRLVTVTGVGGVGKTRLALRVTNEIRRGFVDGVCWVELSGLQEADLLPHVVAEALGIQDVTVRSMEEVLADFVAARQMLLVLDTCEHLVDACATLVAGLLRAAPGLRVLATSRQPLNIDGEHLLVVPPLPVQAGISDGVELFVERAQAVRRSFALNRDNREVVARLCRRLDGIPLAIELAAARLRTLPAREVLDRLDDRFGLLAMGRRTGVARHETLQTTIGWSHELCTPTERLLWARLSVFAGTMDLVAVEGVCTDERLPVSEVADVMAGLVGKSIVLREGHAGRVRFRLLDTLRAFGLEQLFRSGEQERLRRRHRDYYLGLAKRFEADWCGPRQVLWCQRLNQEHANLRAALDLCLTDPAEQLTGLELAGALREYWMACGLGREGQHYLDRLLSRELPPSRTLVTALWACAWLAVAQGDFAKADRRLAQCRPYVRAHGDTATAAWIAYVAGVHAMFGGDQAKAIALTEESANLHRYSGLASTGLSATLAAQAMALSLAGEFDRAVAVTEECREVSERYGEQWMRSYADYMRALAELGRGNPTTAVVHAREALGFKRQLGDSLGIALTLDLLASAAAAQGHAERAARLLGIAHRLWRTFGLPQADSPDLRAARQTCEHQARTELGDSAYQAAFDAGQELDLDTAIAYALDERDEPPRNPEGAAAPAPLTRRERQVAELVAEGLTNQQIATRLLIAKRTADTHVGHILSKLGLGTRSQIAAWVTEGRLATGPE